MERHGKDESEMAASDPSISMQDSSSYVQSHEAHEAGQLQNDGAQSTGALGAAADMEGHAMRDMHDGKQQQLHGSGHVHAEEEREKENDVHRSSMLESADRHDDETEARDTHDDLHLSAAHLQAAEGTRSLSEMYSSPRTAHELGHEMQGSDTPTSAHAHGHDMHEESEERQHHFHQQTDYSSTSTHQDHHEQQQQQQHSARNHSREFDMNNCVIVPDHCDSIKAAITSAGVCFMQVGEMAHAFMLHTRLYFAAVSRVKVPLLRVHGRDKACMPCCCTSCVTHMCAREMRGGQRK
jgi:hypothetical protein